MHVFTQNNQWTAYLNDTNTHSAILVIRFPAFLFLDHSQVSENPIHVLFGQKLNNRWNVKLMNSRRNRKLESNLLNSFKLLKNSKIWINSSILCRIVIFFQTIICVFHIILHDSFFLLWKNNKKSSINLHSESEWICVRIGDPSFHQLIQSIEWKIVLNCEFKCIDNALCCSWIFHDQFIAQFQVINWNKIKQKRILLMNQWFFVGFNPNWWKMVCLWCNVFKNGNFRFFAYHEFALAPNVFSLSLSNMLNCYEIGLMK